MTDCKECHQQVFPTDPTKRWYNNRTKRWVSSLCETCSYYMSLEYRLERLEDEIPKTEPKWTGKEWDTVKQLQGMVRHLENKVMEQRASKKKEEYLYK